MNYTELSQCVFQLKGTFVNHVSKVWLNGTILLLVSYKTLFFTEQQSIYFSTQLTNNNFCPVTTCNFKLEYIKSKFTHNFVMCLLMSSDEHQHEISL